MLLLVGKSNTVLARERNSYMMLSIRPALLSTEMLLVSAPVHIQPASLIPSNVYPIDTHTHTITLKHTHTHTS